MRSSRKVIKSTEVHWGPTIAFKPPPPPPAPVVVAPAAPAEPPALPFLETLVPVAALDAGPARQAMLAEVETEKARLLQATQAQAVEIEQQARAKAAEIEQLARAQAAEFEQYANEKAEAVVNTAKAQAEEVTQAARRAGYEAAEADAGQLLLAAQGVLDEVRVWRSAIYAQSEQAVLDLVAHIAKVIFGEGVVLAREALEAAFTRAVTEARPLGNLRIHIHPEDAALLNPLWAQQVTPAGQRLELLADEAVRRGGCLVEGEFGVVDARVDAQLQLALQTLASDMPAAPEKTGEAPA